MLYCRANSYPMFKNPFRMLWPRKPKQHIKITEDDLERFRQYLVNLTPEEVKNLGKVGKREQKKRKKILAEVRELSNIPCEVLNRPCTGFGSALYIIRFAMHR
ncbi:MAG: hypothetical protein QG654_450 [Patescibacteria group bacterium]|nr:hypothetical protein [Patescibacteria group bacterium]